MIFPSIQHRDLPDAYLKIFFTQENDPEASLMAAYPSKNEAAFFAHWKKKVPGNVQTILFNQSVAGSIESWELEGKRLVGYWIGREYWGKGIATAALQKFLTLEKRRPLYAYVANHNKGSMRVLEKCGFRILGQGTIFSEVHGHDIEETHFICK